jgi:GxxExxY protein
VADQEFFHKDLTYAIIGAAMEVHKVLGPGFLESVYEEALAHEFDLRGIPYQRQARLAVRYKEIVAGEFRADFLVDSKVVVELKAVKALTEGDEAQLLNYLKGTGYREICEICEICGYNFSAPSLEHKRRVL